MKYRTGFVSNSSSSSFVCALSKLNAEQLVKLLAYQDSPENTDGWAIHCSEDIGLVNGHTTMDNGALGDWCEKNGYNKVRFEGGW